jgi:pimeloyl-ACP methyl ester carboxylesterase
MNDTPSYGAGTLGEGIRSRFIQGVNGLDIHLLEAGFDEPGRPCILLLHGFPELAYSWRKVMLPLAAAGYHVVAPDQRGYGRTTGWDADYDVDLVSYRMLHLARDALGLLFALGYPNVAAVVGHDFGSSVAAHCALIRPDVFRSVVLMSAPFGGPPEVKADGATPPDIHAALAALPRPRKHYQWYYSTRPANDDMVGAPQGMHDFLRGYYHHKSADWAGNEPYPLSAWTADELAKMPTYYIMEHGQTMAETVAAEMPTADEIAACAWLREDELAVYAGEFTRTGFQGGLNWYRARTSGKFTADLEIFSGRTIDVPAYFIAGASDWGIYQAPGSIEAMRDKACSAMTDVHLLPGAGHWVQQEQPGAVSALLLSFLEQHPHG